MSQAVRLSVGDGGTDDRVDRRLDRYGRRDFEQAHALRSPRRKILMSWREKLREGVVIPAHPLALTAARKLDERRQRVLTRYYRAAGAGGVAVGVHTTQFAIRNVGLYRPVLEIAAEEARDTDLIKVAGVVGRTPQAVREAEIAAGLGYHTALLSLG